MIKIKRFEFNYFGENTYVVWNENSCEAVVIDPGMMNARECAELVECVEMDRLQLKAIWLTHMHIDHTLGVDYLRERYGLDVYAHKADVGLGRMRQKQAEMFHLPIKVEPIEVDKYVKADTLLSVGADSACVLETPGHSGGGVCYYFPDLSVVFTGDTLFLGSIGRTDLPGGNHSQLIHSIHTQLATLPPNTIVYPGHGQATTIASEIASNPFF
jgi:glyoxylase-like metal-dependent hydrolase (beta-lactamase superfamily II)